MRSHYNRKYLFQNRKGLRNHSTSAESALWLLINKKQLEGRRFRRQFSVDNYILDFYCPQEKLAVELDREVHYSPEGITHDQIRNKYLKRLGITVLRFDNWMVFESPEAVLDEIKKCFKK